jgi:hypothetical protein
MESTFISLHASESQVLNLMCTLSYVQWRTLNSAPKHRHGKSSVAKTTRCFWRVFWGFRQKGRQWYESHDKNFSWLDWLPRSDLLWCPLQRLYYFLFFSLEGEKLDWATTGFGRKQLDPLLAKAYWVRPIYFPFLESVRKSVLILAPTYLYVHVGLNNFLFKNILK